MSMSAPRGSNWLLMFGSDALWRISFTLRRKDTQCHRGAQPATAKLDRPGHGKIKIFTAPACGALFL
jgi:hypothetical protein